jgi:membrane fusion protein, heavy metal efflux system
MNFAGHAIPGWIRPCPLARMVLLAIMVGVLLPQDARAARWFDNLPADDPDVVVRHGATTIAPPLPPQPAGIADVATGVVGLAYGATTGLISSVVGGISAIGSGAREAVWETAYMFGFNSTKVPRAEFVDSTPELELPPDDAAPGPVQVEASIPAAAEKEAAVTTPATPAAPAASPAAPAVAVAAAEPQSRPEPQLKPIDPGLLGNFIYDRGARRPDGSFFVPKPLQRLFSVRTARATAAEVPETLQLAGRIVPDPHSHGDVEASLLGRVEPPPAGLPVLGDTVKKGQVLGYVIPAVGVVDRTQVRREVARLTTEIRVETENLEILKQFTFVPFRDGKIYQSEQRLTGLRREREALLPMLQTQEALRAPTDGVISTSTAIAGRIVHPGEKVFEIVNPKMLWIEALAPDPSTAASAQRVVKASATTPEGQALSLTFIGSGLALQEQSTPILFRIDNPPADLRVGRPVSVAVQSENRSERGLPITRDALTIGSDGVQEVWEQSEPEVFLPRAVTTKDIDGRSVLIVNGLKEGAHVVVSGVRLLAQLQ